MIFGIEVQYEKKDNSVVDVIMVPSMKNIIKEMKELIILGGNKVVPDNIWK